MFQSAEGCLVLFGCPTVPAGTHTGRNLWRIKALQIPYEPWVSAVGMTDIINQNCQPMAFLVYLCSGR